MRDDSDETPSDRRVRGLPEGSTREDLRLIALYQRIILICIGLLFVLYIGAYLVLSKTTPDTFLIVVFAVGVPITLVVLTSVVTTFLLSVKVYHPVVGVLLSIFVMLGCFGLLVLFLINQRATAILNKNGITVGFFGASQSQFKSGID